MTDFQPLAQFERIDSVGANPQTTAEVYLVEGTQVAVFLRDDRWYAVAAGCPHQGASLANASVEAGCVVCPRHGWRFDLESGDCTTQPSSRLPVFELQEDSGQLQICLDSVRRAAVTTSSADPTNVSHLQADGIHRWLVRYGAMGWIGRFGSVHEHNCRHGDLVVIATPRGQETGELLSGPETHRTPENETLHGELLEVLPTNRWENRGTIAGVCTAQRAGIAEHLLERLVSEAGRQELDVEFVDCELLYDGLTVVAYYLGPESPELERIRQILADTAEIALQLTPAVDRPPTAGSGGCGSGGCGSGGCGSGGGGCGSETGGGGCASGGCGSS